MSLVFRGDWVTFDHGLVTDLQPLAHRPVNHQTNRRCNQAENRQAFIECIKDVVRCDGENSVAGLDFLKPFAVDCEYRAGSWGTDVHRSSPRRACIDRLHGGDDLIRQYGLSRQSPNLLDCTGNGADGVQLARMTPHYGLGWKPPVLHRPKPEP